MSRSRMPRSRVSRCFAVASIGPLTLILAAGCSPPPPETAEVRLSVGMPSGDPGRLTDAPIGPPNLTDLDATSAHAVAMRFADGSQLVQTQAGGGRVPIEVVPTPEPDPKNPDSGKFGKNGAGKISPEIVPAPEGVPTGKMATGGGELGTDAAPIRIALESGAGSNAFPEGTEGPEDYRTWPLPDLALVVTGQQHGYIEPCGCTGLDRQKGGIARRFTFIEQLRKRGWNLMPIDAGNLVRRFGRQAEVKLQQSVKALEAMDYQAIGFGPDDIRLGVGELLAVAAGDTPDDTRYVSANVVLIDPSLMPQFKLVEKNGMKVGITSVLDPEALEVATSDEILIEPPVESARKALAELTAAAPDFKVLMFFGTEEDGQDLVRQSARF